MMERLEKDLLGETALITKGRAVSELQNKNIVAAANSWIITNNGTIHEFEYSEDSLLLTSTEHAQHLIKQLLGYIKESGLSERLCVARFHRTGLKKAAGERYRETTYLNTDHKIEHAVKVVKANKSSEFTVTKVFLNFNRNTDCDQYECKDDTRWGHQRTYIGSH